MRPYDINPLHQIFVDFNLHVYVKNNKNIYYAHMVLLFFLLK